MRPRLDTPRATLRLGEAELDAAVTLVSAPGHPSLEQPSARAAVAALTAAGIVHAGRIEGFPARLLSVVAEARLRLTVEAFLALGTEVDRVWATSREGVWGSVASDGQLELAPVERGSIASAVARSVGLEACEPPPDARPIAVAAAALATASQLLAGRDERGAAGALAELDADDRAALLAVLGERRLSWRVTAGERELAAVDAGPRGLWVTYHEGETVRLVPFPASAVFKRLTEMTR